MCRFRRILSWYRPTSIDFIVKEKQDTNTKKNSEYQKNKPPPHRTPTCSYFLVHVPRVDDFASIHQGTLFRTSCHKPVFVGTFRSIPAKRKKERKDKGEVNDRFIRRARLVRSPKSQTYKSMSLVEFKKPFFTTFFFFFLFFFVLTTAQREIKVQERKRIRIGSELTTGLYPGHTGKKH